MLTVAKVTSGLAVLYADYLQAKSQAPELGDYYLRDGERVEAPGRWAGGARAVGADPARSVSGEQLRLLMTVRRPDTGLPLRRVGGSGEAVAAIDATFSAPKSVSAAWALASPELRDAIERAQELAVDRALGYAVEQVAMIRERVDAHTVIHAKPAEVIATSWRHTTARARGWFSAASSAPPTAQSSHVSSQGWGSGSSGAPAAVAATSSWKASRSRCWTAGPVAVSRSAKRSSNDWRTSRPRWPRSSPLAARTRGQRGNSCGR